MKKISLAWQIFIGLVLGVLIGSIFYGNPQIEAFLKPIGDIFIRLIRTIVIPIVISSLVVGVAGTGDIKKVGKLGVKTLVYFEIITTLAILVGLAFVNIFKPGNGIDISMLQKADITGYVNSAEKLGDHKFIDTFVNIVPTNIFESLARGNMLSIIFFSVIFGLGVASIGEKGKPVLRFFEGASAAMFRITNQIMKLAPFGVFALIGITVSKFGISSLLPLSKLIFVVYIAMIFFVVVVFGGVARIFGVNIFSLIALLEEELILAFSTASSETVLPKIMEKMEKFGCPEATVSFVVPTGYSFNLDGSTLYQAIAAIFVAQMYNIDMPLSAQIYFLLVLMITSKGIAGVPGVSFVVLLATFGSVGLPIQGLAFIAGVDRILDMARTAVNVLGNSLAAIVIAKWEGEFIPSGERIFEDMGASSEISKGEDPAATGCALFPKLD
ncbi:MAG: cation:dicarboxylase symporter family transporter [Oligoflexales bacterium]|nr:cation:dicarboxylase symporter family transporter [Oligoflexales bacterium]